MGNFYSNLSVKTENSLYVAETLRIAGYSTLVTPPQGGYVIVYQEKDAQISEIGILLSKTLQTTVFAVMNHDDDIFCYWLFERGCLADSYNSCPDYFGEEEGEGQSPVEPESNPERVCHALEAKVPLAEVEAVLEGMQDFHNFVIDQHRKLALLLNLPSWSVGFGWTYISWGELDDQVRRSELLSTGARN